MKHALGTTGPIDSWAILPVTWSLGGKKPHVPDRPDNVIGSLAPNQLLRMSVADYPPGAKGRGEHGICWVHVKLSESGEVQEIRSLRAQAPPILTTPHWRPSTPRASAPVSLTTSPSAPRLMWSRTGSSPMHPCRLRRRLRDNRPTWRSDAYDLQAVRLGRNAQCPVVGSHRQIFAGGVLPK